MVQINFQKTFELIANPLSFIQFLGRIEESHMIASKIRREFHFYHSLVFETWTPLFVLLFSSFHFSFNKHK